MYIKAEQRKEASAYDTIMTKETWTRKTTQQLQAKSPFPTTQKCGVEMKRIEQLV